MLYSLALVLIVLIAFVVRASTHRTAELTVRVRYAIHEVVVAGATHITLKGTVQRSTIYPELHAGQRLRLVREPDCVHDQNAVLVYAEDGPMTELDLGYIPKRFAQEVAAHMDNDEWPVLAEVKAVERHGKYKSLRISVYLPEP
jgi:hypothetical protein